MNRPIRRYLFFITTTLFSGVLCSCIKNDIPYPSIVANFESFVIEEAAKTTINTNTRQIVVSLKEEADPKALHLTDYTLTPKAKITPVPDALLDLSSPQQYTLSIYQDYLWTVRSEQPIERRFVVEGQIGEPIFNTEEHIALTYVTDQYSLKSIVVTDLKLGPTGASQTPLFSEITDFTTPQTFTVQFRNETQTWTVVIMQSDESVSTLQADGWTKIAWLKGSGPETSDNGFEIRKATESNWQRVDNSLIKQEGGLFSARVGGLEPDTEYRVRAYSGQVYGGELSFRTDVLTPLPNASLDNWSKDPDKSKLWNPWALGETRFWDTGNKGATTLGDSNSYPTDEICPAAQGVGLAAKLESRWIILKLAAGNLFAGEYLRTDVTDGVLNFGQPYTARPTRLRGYYKYQPKPIDKGESNNPDLFAKLKGKNDTCSIQIALTDWTEPFEVRTKPSNKQLFDKNNPGIIAYAEFKSGTPASEYALFDLELAYRSTSRKPTYIVVVATSSCYGDFFIGGAGSILWLDQMELVFE